MHVSVCKSGYQACGHHQCSFARGRVKRLVRHSSPVQQLPDQWPLSTAPVNSQAEAELITRLQQQNGASASHQAPPLPRVLIPRETPNVQEGTDIPTGPAPPPILPQLSKTPTNLPDSPFEFEVDPTILNVSNLEKMFKKSQGVKSIPNIEDGYTDAAVTLSDRL
ncbi:hypothetical protein CsSME_00031289 [Camellia sinensis var. sinensis]